MIDSQAHILNLDNLSRLLSGQGLGLGQANLSSDAMPVQKIKIDNREISQNDLFIAIRGKRLDGHQFALSAIQQGAKAVVVDHRIKQIANEQQIVVKDTTKAFGKIANAWRQQFTYPLIGITGSCGKTTVKEMTSAILSHYFKAKSTNSPNHIIANSILATKGNLNNEFGVPMTLLELSDNHQAAIIEMGANHLNEISYLNSLANVDIALITNAGTAHIEGFGSRENIAKGKGEIYQTLKDQGTAIINADDPHADYWKKLILKRNNQINIVSFGFSETADISAQAINESYQVSTPSNKFALQLSVPGKHNMLNALAAIAIAYTLKVPETTIKESLEKFNNISGRLETWQNKQTNITIFNDTYNANPESVKAGIDVLTEQNSQQKILILGDMKELGDDAQQLHTEVGKYAAKHQLSQVLSCGELSELSTNAFNDNLTNQKQSNAKHFNIQYDLINYLRDQTLNDSSILVKGSRSMAMENIVEQLKNQLVNKPEKDTEVEVVCS